MALRDPDIEHQIVLRTRLGQITVSCNCRRVLGKWDRTRKGEDYYQPMDRKPDESIFDTYNRPENHSPNVPFSEKWRIRG